MSTDQVFRRVGRGGAGNWYSKKDVEEAEKAAPKDLEAQKPAEVVPAAGSAGPEPGYARAGRGGAGNFYGAEAAAADKVDKDAEARKTAAAAAASIAKPRAGLGGRGGAGNWRDAPVNDGAAPGDKARAAAIQARVVQDVEAGLAMPPRTYHQHDRDVE